jgi:DNA helicase-2/ATP-dependent DNA helicase PcrA
MTIYAMAASEILQKPIEKIKLSFFYFENQTKVSTVRTKEQLEDAKKKLLAIRDEIEKSDFQCSHHMLCDNCEFKILCND